MFHSYPGANVQRIPVTLSEASDSGWLRASLNAQLSCHPNASLQRSRPLESTSCHVSGAQRCAPRAETATAQPRCLHQGRTLGSLHDRPLSESNVQHWPNPPEPFRSLRGTTSRFRRPYLCQQPNRRSLRRPDWETGGLAGRRTEDKRSASARKPVSKTAQ